MKTIVLIVILSSCLAGFAQREEPRIENIRSQLELLTGSNKGLNQNVKTQVNVTDISLGNFLLGLASLSEVNINVDPALNAIKVANTFSNVTLADLLVFLCKEHDLTIDFTGSILSIKPYQEPELPPDEIQVSYSPRSDLITISSKAHKLQDVFKLIMDKTGKNLVYAPGMENQQLTAYFKDVSFDAAMDKLALANNLIASRTKDHFYVFDRYLPEGTNGQAEPIKKLVRRRSGNLTYKILDAENMLIEMQCTNEPIANIIYEIAEALGLDIFTASPLDDAGYASFQASRIGFDQLLTKLFEMQTINPASEIEESSGRRNQVLPPTKPEKLFSFKKEGRMYFIGTEDQLSIRKVEVIYLKHRSVDLLSDPEAGGFANNTTSTIYSNLNATDDRFRGSLNGNNPRNNGQNNDNNFQNFSSKGEALLSVLPEELMQDLDIKVDSELNSFYVNGPSEKVERFKRFVEQVDKPVPVVLIEVMILEVNRSNLVDTGISFGIGDQPVETSGTAFPETNLTLGANTVNRIIGSFNDFGGFNLGRVGPNFFATIKAMEANGDLKVRSTPRLATLNSHRATFSNGQTSFYAVTRRNIYGTDNPQTSEITNYLPIDAQLGLTIRPSVSGNGQVLLDISVVQSSFGQRVAEDAPPDVNSRSFSSLIRMQDQDIAILGGLEEQMTNDSGSGVPLLARVPVIKWLFSKRKREAKKAKLTVLIKPTVIF